jgi:hypothetical protein
MVVMMMMMTTIIIIINIISLMQGIHTYIPETNHVSSVYSVAAIPRVLLMVHIALSSILNSFVLHHHQYYYYYYYYYLSSIPGKHNIKELQKTAILGTVHILRKVLM